MIKIYKAPIPAPKIDWRGDWQTQEKEYLNQLKELAKRNGSNDLLGEIVRFPVADGYAQYMVWNIKPFQLIWIELGDAWDFRYIDRLSPSDIKKEIASQRSLDALFKKK